MTTHEALVSFSSYRLVRPDARLDEIPHFTIKIPENLAKGTLENILKHIISDDREGEILEKYPDNQKDYEFVKYLISRYFNPEQDYDSAHTNFELFTENGPYLIKDADVDVSKYFIEREIKNKKVSILSLKIKESAPCGIPIQKVPNQNSIGGDKK